MRKVTQELVYEVLGEIVDNTYYLLTCQKTFDDLLNENTNNFPVMFLVEPEKDFEGYEDIYDLLIEYYEEEEQYERCKVLYDIKQTMF